MTATRPAPTDAQVEALAREMFESYKRRNPGDWDVLAKAAKRMWRRDARAALSSSVIGDLIADVVKALDPCHGGEEQHDRHLDVCVPFYDRAAALSPTPADGTTSERSEA